MKLLQYRQQYFECVRDRLSYVNQLRSAMKKCLLSSSAKRPILEALVDYMVMDVSDVNANSVLVSADRMLENAVFWDRIATFKLALWKFACIRSLKDTNLDIGDMMHWFGKGWKKAMGEQLQSSVFSIIVPLVLPFLGKPGEQNMLMG